MNQEPNEKFNKDELAECVTLVAWKLNQSLKNQPKDTNYQKDSTD